jgi:hypothetical protein
VSEATQVFLSTGESPTSVADVVSRTLGDEFKATDPGNQIASWESSRFFVDLETTDGLVDDEELPFTTYDYFLDIEAREPVYTADPAGEERFARAVFQRLAGLSCYALLLVARFQHRLDNFDPSPAARKLA